MKKRTVAGLFLLAFCLLCRYCLPAADFYAEKLYPFISGTLSLAGSLLPFSLTVITVICLVATFLLFIVQAIRHRDNSFFWLRKSLSILLWAFVWFYMGWGNNYYRTGLYQRNGIRRVSYDEVVFKAFLDDYSAQLNRASVEAGEYDRNSLEEDMKRYYSEEVSRYGYTALRRWQHIKKPMFNRLFSAVSVSGFMGPYFCESHVNRDVLEVDYPFVAAHELAHLAGVSGEAEASWWAFHYCRGSSIGAVRYGGYLSLLPYVLQNARMLLSEADYDAWTASLCIKAIEDYKTSSEHWKKLRVTWIDRLQSWFYDLFLRGNGVSAGIEDYFGVVSMVMTMDAAAI